MSEYPSTPTPPHQPTNPNNQPDHDPDGLPGSAASVAPDVTTDHVPGDPPVPTTVWRTAREPGEDPSPIPRRLAHRLVIAYSRPGDAVIDLTPGHALTAEAVAGARRHHKAWFTDASALIVGPSTSTEPTEPVHGDAFRRPNAGPGRAAPTPAGHARGTAGAHHDGPPVLDAEPLEVAAWFGDDLTDDLPPHDRELRAATRLVVASGPLASGGPAAEANHVRLGWLLTACAQLLRPGGCLVLVVTPAGTVSRPEDFRPLLGAARTAGLLYLQHIVAVHADTDGDQFIYHATDEEVLGLVRANPGSGDAPHRRVHADLLVLSHSSGNAASAPGRRP